MTMATKQNSSKIKNGIKDKFEKKRLTKQIVNTGVLIHWAFWDTLQVIL